MSGKASRKCYLDLNQAEIIEKFGREELQRMLVEIKMTQTGRENTTEVFREGIERLLKDPAEMERPNE